ncbi:MAG: Serine/threonine-protein kinase PknD [Phycisphaerae bacterium]|nr:Serine/threonine-protein kinase PknD [Phycisphaerae bacterium]
MSDLDATTPSGHDHAPPTRASGGPPGSWDADDRPQQIGRYRILDVLGQGGMGVVYLAEQREPVRRRVALKLIKLGMDTREVVARFDVERQTLALMSHPNVAAVYDAGATETGRPYFVMEHVAGTPINQFCDSGRHSICARLEIFLDVCGAIQHAHQRGIIHRDLKPSNLLVTLINDHPTPKVIDFGVAKATADPHRGQTLYTAVGRMIGTPEYMSPEQAEASLDIDTRTDVYSLGVVLYELLCGELPVDGMALRSAGVAGVSQVIRATLPPRPSTRLTEPKGSRPARPASVSSEELTLPGSSSQSPPRSPHRPRRSVAEISAARGTEPDRLRSVLRGDLDWIVMKAIEKERVRRYDSVAALADDLRRYLEGRPVAARPPTLAYQFSRFARRHRVLLGAAAGVLTALLLGLTASLYGMVQASRARGDAETALRAEAAQRFRAERAQETARENQLRAEEQTRIAEKSQRAAEVSGRRAAAINEFLLDMLGSADVKAAGRNATVSQVLQSAAGKVGRGLSSEPEVEAGVRTVVGRIFTSMGMLDEAEPHLTRARELLEAHEPHGDQIAQVRGAAASIARARNELPRAETGLREAIAAATRDLGPESSRTRGLQADLALTLSEQKKYDEAEAIYRELLTLARRLDGDGDNHTLLVINSLAVLLHYQKRYDEAEPLYREAVEVGERVHGASDPDTLVARMNLASMQMSRNRYREAEPVVRGLVAEIGRVFGEQHPNYATALRIAADCSRNLGNFREALPMWRQAYAATHALQGDQRDGEIMSLRGLAQALSRLGQHAEAIETQRRVLSMSSERYGPDHQDTISARTNLANYLKSSGKSGEAVELLRQSLDDARRVLGGDHPETIIATNSLATALHSLDRLAEAEVLYRDALEAGKRAVGANQPDTLITMHNLMCVLRDQGHRDEALNLGRDVIRRFERVMGPEHASTSTAYSSVGQLLTDMGQLDEAQALFESALRIRRKTLGERSPETTGPMIELADVHIRQGNSEQAEPLLREALAIRRGTLGDSDRRTAFAASALGRCLIELGMLDEAEILLRQAEHTMSGDPDTSLRERQRVLERLLAIAERQGRAALAESRRAQLAALIASTQPATSQAQPNAP